MERTYAIVKTEKTKMLHLELLRIVACYFVIFNHTSSDGFFLFSRYNPSTLQYWVYSFISVFCKFSVPMFFSISGALLLPKEESIKAVYLKRVFRMIPVLLLTSLFYYCFDGSFDFSKLSVRGFLLNLYTGNQCNHLWYLYAFIPFLMGLPILRATVKGLRNEHFLYIMIIALFFSAVLPFCEIFLYQNQYQLYGHFNMSWLITDSFLFPIIGYYLENKLDTQKVKRKLPYFWIANVITIFLTCFATYYRSSIIHRYDESFYGSFVLIQVITLYVTAKCLFSSKNTKTLFGRIVYSVGSATFGIYLVHFAVLKILYQYKLFDMMINAGLNSMIASFLFCLIVMFISYLLVLIGKKILLMIRLL